MSTSKYQQQQQSQNLQAKLIADNNKKAYDLLMRIQSQLEASRVIATSSHKVASYE